MQVTDEMVRVAKDAFKESCGLTINGDSAMRAAITAALGAMWRPICEAPKDGAWILVYFHDRDIGDEFAAVARYVPPRGTGGCKYGDYVWETIDSNGGYYAEYLATNFMHIPSPPAQEG